MELLTKLSQQLGITEDFNIEGDIFTFGIKYQPLPKKSTGELGDDNITKMWTKTEENREFLEDVESRVFFTYRSQFMPIPKDPEGPSPISFSLIFRDNPINTLENVLTDPDSFHSDIGWGCMIRTGQALLGNAIQRIKLGRNFRFKMGSVNKEEMKIVSWFDDSPEYPLSLHQFVFEGKRNSGTKPGEWFGPSATSRSIQSLVANFPACGIDRCLLSTQSGELFKDEINSIFSKNENSNLLLLFPVKLGVDKINSIYWNDLFSIVASAYSVGIAGGKPSSSLYFFGHQNEHLFYLDPHKTQNSSLISDNLTFYKSCHGHKFSRIHISETDPSMLIGILIQGTQQWDDWQRSCENNNIIHILDSRPPIDMFENIEMYVDEGSIDSSSSQQQKDNIDYVDIGTIVSVKHSSSLSGEDFENLKCKNQRILVGEDASEMEEEQVLVEDSSQN